MYVKTIFETFYATINLGLPKYLKAGYKHE